MKIVKFIPETPYATPLRSDTLFGIICWGARWIYGADLIKEWLAGFQTGAPPFLFSSAFPFAEVNGKTQYFLPKPVLPLAQVKHSDNQRLKDFRKLPFLNLEDFVKVITGNHSLWEIFVQKEKYEVVKEESDLLTYNRFDRLYWNTSGETGQVYQEPIYYFAKPPEDPQRYGIYIWLKAEQEILNKLQAIWRYWEDVGIGKNASIGLGKFQIKMEDAPELKLPTDAEQQITLSLYQPTLAELQAFTLNKDRFWYQLIVRKGRIGGVVYTSPNPFKPKLLMLGEGSVFPTLNQPYYGQTVKISTRDHPIYHYGYALTIPARFKEVLA